MRFQVADDIAEFVRRKTEVNRYGQIAQPDFGFPVAGPHVDMWRFVALVGLEKGQ